MKWQEAIDTIQALDQGWKRQARQRLESLTMPHWALGRLMDSAESLAGMTRSLAPQVKQKVVITMAADHGVSAEGVSKYPQEVTAQMVLNFIRGGAGINALATASGAKVFVVDMGVNSDLLQAVEPKKIIRKSIAAGTNNMAQGPAMSRAQAEQAIQAGFDIVMSLKDDADLIGTGDMGIANTTASTAIAAVLTGREVEDLTGPGTGIDDNMIRHKISIIQKSIAVNQPDPEDAVDILAKVGGFEIGGIAGVILAAAFLQKPVLVDGFISTAAALLVHAICPCAMDYVIASHQSAEPGHRYMLEHLNKSALLHLDMRLGEGTGAALAMPLMDAAAALLTDVATFDEAEVSRADS